MHGEHKFDINMFHRIYLLWRLVTSQDNDFGSEDRLFPINDQHFVHVHSACPRVTRKKLDIYRQLVKNNKKVENISQLIKNLFAYFYRVFFDPQMFSTKMKKRDATNKSYCFKKLMWKASHCVGRAIFFILALKIVRNSRVEEYISQHIQQNQIIFLNEKVSDGPGK